MRPGNPWAGRTTRRRVRLLVDGPPPALARRSGSLRPGRRALPGLGRPAPRDPGTGAAGGTGRRGLPAVAVLVRVLVACRPGFGAGLVAAAAVLPWGGPVLAAAAALALGTAARSVSAGLRRRAHDRAVSSLSAALTLLAAEWQAGSRPAEALRAAAELAPARSVALQAAAARAAAGLDAVAPLAADPLLAPLAHCWRVAEQSGAAPARLVERAAVDLRARVGAERAVAAALAGPRSSAALLAGLPVLGIVLGVAMQADPTAVLLAPGAGRWLCLAGVALDVAGVRWTQRLTTTAARP